MRAIKVHVRISELYVSLIKLSLVNYEFDKSTFLEMGKMGQVRHDGTVGKQMKS